MQEEIWKDIEGYEGLYQVSNKGNVKSLDRVVRSKNNSFAIKKGIYRKQYILFGYRKINLYNSDSKKYKSYFVHRLVAFAFCSGYSEGLVVNHIDEDKLNNDCSNLEWVTQKKNINHGYSLLKRAFSRRENRKKKPVLMIDKENNDVLTCFNDIRDVKDYGYSISCILRVCNNERKTHKGYKWAYKENKK